MFLPPRLVAGPAVFGAPIIVAGKRQTGPVSPQAAMARDVETIRSWNGGLNMKLNHRNAQRAFTLFEAVLVIVILAVLIAVFLPALIRPKARSSRLGCVNNLKQIGLAFHGWG